jgi:glycosylphosphatidylinositol transamidase (GPIT) subunit GPI8
MSDSCSAITPFETIDIENFTAFGSSSFDEKSQSHGYDPLLNAPKSDDFTFYLN